MKPIQTAFATRFPQRATTWTLRSRQLHFGNVPLVMGIVNATPDSFSDGGKFLDPQSAVDHALDMVNQGADILDVGGESTRPYSEPVDLEQELGRVVPVIERLAPQIQIPISIDTSKAEVARQALAAGAEIVNDVTGLSGDAAMLDLVRAELPGVCVMHMQGTPQTMQDDPAYADVVRDVAAYLVERQQSLVRAGIPLDHICLDPGIGFGKTHQHNLDLVAHAGALHGLGSPLLVGHSRKGFLARVLQDKTADRTAATVGVAVALAMQGVQIVRVHDVRPVKEACQVFAAVGAVDGQVLRCDP